MGEIKTVTSATPLISVIMCAHNEEKYVDKSLPSVIKSLAGFPSEIIFVADRCTDKTVEKVKKYPVKIIEKTWKKWNNSYSEALQTGYTHAKGALLSIVDADIMVPPNFFKKLTMLMDMENASVAAHVVTYPKNFLNRLVNAWEKTYKIAPIGGAPYGAARIIFKKVIDEIGGFRDVPTPDTDIDLRLSERGYKSIGTSEVKAYHIRQITLKSIVNGQVNSGRGRYALGISLTKTIGHALLRMRPMVICGWLLERQQARQTSSPTH